MLFSVQVIKILFFLQIMGLMESKPSTQPQQTRNSLSEVEQQNDEAKFKEEVRRSANNFKNLVMNNKVMIFSATYCSYCTVAKVSKLNLFDIINYVSEIVNFFAHRKPWMTLEHSFKVWR